MKKLLLILSFSMIALLDWAQVQNACFSSQNDISFNRGPRNSRGIVQGDFDNDGVLDIVTTSYSSSQTTEKFTFQKGLGNGKFGSPIDGGDNSASSGFGAQEIKKADFNGDGNLDIVFNSSLGVHIYTGQGNGNFSFLVTLNALTNVKMLEVGDFNEDGAVDIICSAGNLTTSRVYFGTVGNPNTFTNIILTSVNGTIKRIGVADMNNDGHQDIVLALTNGIRVFFNTSGSLGTFSNSGIVSSLDPSDLTICDLNGDNIKDVVLSRKASNSIAVFNGDGTGSLIVGNTYSADGGPEDLIHFDINGDGHQDIIVTNANVAKLSIFYNNGSGTLTLNQTTQCPDQPRAITVGQFTSDTYPDIITTSTSKNYINSFVGNASNNYMQTNLFDLPGSPSSSFAGDFNGDGKQDVAITLSDVNELKIYHGNGAGGFSLMSTISTGANPVYVTGGDLNGNGTIDLVVVNKDGNSITVCYGTGTGMFTTSVLTTGTAPVQAKIGNLNGDTNLDIVVVNSGSSNFSTFLATGTTSFAAAVNTTTTANPRSLAIGDFNIDGKQDVAIGFGTSTTMKRYAGDGAGGYAPAANITAANLIVTSMEAADLDGDGDADLVVGSTAAIYRVHNPTSSGAITGSAVATNITLGSTLGSGDINGIRLVDVNNDGKLDIVAVYHNAGGANVGTLAVATATAFGTDAGYVFTPTNVSFSAELNSSGLAMADFNGDNRIDAIIPNAGSKSFTLHYNTTPVISAAGPTTFCNGNSVVLNGTPATQWYEWSPTSEATQNITATTDGIYSLTTSSSWSGWCSSVSDTLKVTVTPGPPAPTATAGGSTTICGSGSVTLTSSSTANNQWYKDDVLIPGATNQTYSASTSGDYTVRFTSGGCSSDNSNTITVTVSQAPNITASGSVNLCFGQTVTLTSDITSNITWSNGATTPSITVSASGSYNVTNNVAGCSSLTSNTINVTVAAQISAPSVTPGGPLTVCSGNSITLTSSATSGNHWSTGATSQSITVTTAGNYTVFQSVGSCNSTNSTPVSVALGATPPAPTITPSGSTSICSGQSITLTASTGANYLWSNGATTQSITVSAAGSYSVKIINAQGCESASSSPVVVTILTNPNAPSITTSGLPVFCSGGSITLTSSVGDFYLWSNGATSQTITVSTSGTYTVQVTNSSGCTSAPSSPQIVTVHPLPTAPTISAAGSTTFCTGGSVNLTSTSASGYLWSTGATTQTISVTTSGTYSVKAVSINGCESSSSNTIDVTVNPPPATPTITSSGATTFCNGDSVVLSTSATGPFHWSNGANTPSITVTTAGNYTLQVGSSGCLSLASNTIAVTVNAVPPVPTITESGATTFCSGQTVTLTSSAASGNTWSTAQTSASISVGTSGSYTVTVSNGSCTATSAPKVITVNPLPPAPVISAGGTTTFCAGGSVTLSSTTGTTYAWTPAGSTQDISVTTSGNYSVVVTDAAGCSSPASNVIPVTVTPLPATPTITTSGSTTFCAGGSVVLTASAGVGYLWSTGSTNPSITVTTSGSYWVKVTDANGCESLQSAPTAVTVNALPAAPVVTAGGSTTICAGSSVMLSSTAGNSYAWTPSGTTQNISVTTSGNYSVVVTNAAGCTSPVSNVISVTVNPLPATPSITPGGPTTFCAGGSVVLTAPNASGWVWSNGGPNAQSITVTSNSSVSVKVIDANGCQSASSVAIPVTVHANPTAPTITPGGPTTFCDGGSVVLTAPNAASWLWSTGATTQTITVTTSEDISVQVINANGCQSVSSNIVPVVVNPIPAAPTITASGPTTFCSGGSVVLTSSIVNNNNWSTGSMNQSITVNTSGTYFVNVTENGCVSPNATRVVTVNALPTTPLITASGSTTFCAGESVILSAPTSSTYLWSTGSTNPSITVTTAGNYTVKVTDANGCQSLSSLATVVTVNPLPATPTISQNGSLTFCQGGTVTLTSSPSSTYLWSNGSTSQSIVVSSSGSYSVKVTNADGCTSLTSATTTVTVNPLPAAPTITASGPVVFCAGNSVNLSSTAGTSYIWSNGAGNLQDITVSTTGSYSAQVTDANGCTSLSSNVISVTVNNLPTTPVISANGLLAFCDGNSVTLSAPNSTGYEWSTGANTQTINVTTSGSYWVKVTNANGCTSLQSASTVVTVNPIPAAPIITSSGPTAFCSGGNVVLTSSANTGNTWSNGSSIQSITVTSSGTYSVTVTENGCVSPSTSQLVTVYSLPSTPSITSSGSNTFCEGDFVTLTASSANAYEWSTGDNTQSITVTASGSYSVKVINSNGCSSAFSTPITVTVNTLPNTPSITPSGLTTFCQGGTINLQSTTATSYIWSTGQTSSSISVNASGSYWVKVKNAAGCESAQSAPIAITVNPLPAAPTITYNTPISFCVGGSVGLTSSTGTSYLWSGGLGTSQTVTITTSGTYSVQIYDGNGCLSAPSTDVTVTVNALPSTPVINASGPVVFCSGNTVDLTCPVSTGYEWSTGATTQSITTGVSGSYTVRRINSNGCISLWSNPVQVIVNAIPATPTITASGATTFCQGNNVILTSSSSTGNSWSTGSASNSITVSTSNTYTLTVTQNGCTSAAATRTVVVNPLPITPNITSSGATTFCSGFYVDLIAAPSGYDYNWSTGATTQAIPISTSGSYTVSITDVNGCTSPISAPMSVTVNPLPPTPTIVPSGTTTFCAGGTVTLSAPSSTAYQWSNGATTASINATTSGSYTVQVTDINGCHSAVSAPLDVTVNALPAAPVITDNGSATTFCAGGSITLTSTPGTTYQWSNSNSTQSIVVNTSGIYTAKITDANGCLSSNSNSIAVTVNPLPSTPVIASNSGTNVICDGNSVLLTAPTSTNYIWSTGANTQTISVTASGGYSVKVIDANGCESLTSTTTNVTVNPIPAAPTINPAGPTTFCAGNTLLLNSSVASGNLWSTNSSNQSITVNSSGVYTLTQTVLGCTSPAASIAITVNPLPPAPNVVASGAVTFCAGGSVTLTSSVTSNILWSTTETSPSITVTTSGLYSVTQTALGCVSNPSNPINVVVNPIPAVPTISTNGNPTTFCAGNTITLTSSAPTGNLWSNGLTTQSITVSNTGSYFVQVILAGCSSGTSATTTVTVNPLPNAPTIVTGTTEAICDGSSVLLTSSSTGGNIWTTGENTQSISVSVAGTYSVQVTDGNGCTSLHSIPTVVTVNPLPAAPTISTSAAPMLCYGEQINLTSSYANGNLWNGGSTANQITVSTAGSYTVIHTDANGCVSPASAPIDVVVNPIPAAPTITPVGSTNFCQGGSVTLNSSEANGNIWSNALTTSSISPTTSGVYSVMFVDANGCTSPSSAPVVVSVMANPPVPSITAPGGATTVCQGTIVSLVSSYTSGNVWSTSATTQNINVSTSGSYTVTYTNANGCSSTSAPTVITVNPVSAIPTISASGSTTICQGSSVTLTSSDTSSVWSSGATTQSITVTSSGTYTVVGSNTGCPSQSSAPITVNVNPAPPVPTITPSGPTTICQGDELYLFTPASGSIQWSTGSTSPVLAITTPGTYFVNVVNAYGCTSSSTQVDVVINSLPNVAMNPFGTVCTNAAPFTLANGIPAGGTYTGNGISANVFNPSIMGNGSTIVTYVYTDINGCAAQAQSIITVSDCLGIDENSKEFALYPNPTEGRFVITSNGVPMDNVVIYDAQGKMVYNESYSGMFSLEFNLNDYSNGLYYIEIISDSEVQNRMPLVINH